MLDIEDLLQFLSEDFLNGEYEREPFLKMKLLGLEDWTISFACNKLYKSILRRRFFLSFIRY